MEGASEDALLFDTNYSAENLNCCAFRSSQTSVEKFHRSQYQPTKMRKTSSMRQLTILLYKGFLLRKRHYVVTFFEIVIPVLIGSVFTMIYSENCDSFKRMNDDSKWKEATTYLPFSPYDSNEYASRLQFVYTPANNFTEKFMKDAVDRFRSKVRYSPYINESKGTENENDLEKYCDYTRKGDSSILLVGTVFQGLENENGSLSDSLEYKIRYGLKYSWQTFATQMKYRTNGPQYDSIYTRTYFLAWQASVEQTFIDKKMEEINKSLDYEVWMQRFPYPEHYDSKFSFLSLVPYVINFGYFIFVVNMIRRIIEEKANGSKELLKMMGMTDFMYWLSTFLNYFLLALITILVLTIVYKAPLKSSCVFIEQTDFTLLFFLLVLYMVNLILFGMALSVFFNKAVFAIVVYIIINNITFSLLASNYFSFNSNVKYILLSSGAKLGLCLLPEGGLLTTFFFLATSNTMGKGVHWNNLSDFTATNDLNMSMVIGMMILSAILYTILLWYFDAVWPWQNGVPKPFYFMFTRSYWCGFQSADENDIIELRTQDDQTAEFFEVEPRGMFPGVIIKKLSKAFRTGLQTKLAVNNVSLNIFQGQITALLGHNGAGKTTTINILTGLFTPSSGTASINGFDILSKTRNARQGLGVCPQHNVLFDTLTPEEHLKLYAALKGVPWSELTAEASKTLALLNLTDKRNALVKTLSGGMKRKLSLGIAIIGGSKVLFLDEPTSGMDVEARRAIWDTLRDIRHDRTIILTTHYMEEADILGDRIAIMAEGEIQCCGSSMFLKQKFGTGYHLHVVKGEKFVLKNLTTVIEKYIPGAALENETGLEVTYKLISDTDSNFGNMFEEMENNKTQLGFTSYGVTITTMEDVFLNVANISDLKYKIRKESHSHVENGVSFPINDMFGPSTRVKRQPHLAHQLYALLLKRFHYTKRNWSILVTQLILPFVLMCICLYLINFFKNPQGAKSPALELNIKKVYGSTEGFYSFQKPELQTVAETIKNVLEENSVEVKELKDPTPYILEYGKKDISKYWMKFLTGGMADTKNAAYNLTAWYNGEPYHIVSMSLLLMHRALLKNVKSSTSITLTNAPLPLTDTYGYSQAGAIESLMASIFVPLSLAFLTASYVILPTHERVSKAKLLQIMNGLPGFMYWIAMFLWDILVHSVVSIILIIPFAIFSKHAFFSPHSDGIGTALLLMLLNGWASIPLSYLVSKMFKKGSTNFSVIICISAIFAVAVVPILTTLGLTTGAISYKQVDVLVWFLRLLPPFSLAFGFSNLFGAAFKNSLCDSISKEALKNICASPTLERWNTFYQCCPNKCGRDCLQQTNLFTWDKVGCARDIFALFFDGCLYFVILFLIESSIMTLIMKIMSNQIKKLRRPVAGTQQTLDNTPEDPDVTNERQRIHYEHSVTGNAGDKALVVLDLTKSFKTLCAVDHLTFCIHQEECFGLLGVNGAGKTTTFMMLTGDIQPTEGNAIIQNHSVLSDPTKFQSYLGYCPQFDALIDRLTGREMLYLFGRLRGLTGMELDDQVNKMIKMTDLSAHADKQTRLYSGGNKRKLSIGISMIGFPSLILLDEPTAGVDPVSRRKIWNVLSQARNNAGSAVLLTTHSMEETEALCSRLAIMVNGQFRCLGSIQHLKSKYGQGHTLVIKMKREAQDNLQAVSAVKAHIQNRLHGADLKDEHQGMLQYHVVNPEIKLHHLFNFMFDMKAQFNLEDYLISETTLEQIFLTFARSQRITATK